jgi:hypothetical protein
MQLYHVYIRTYDRPAGNIIDTVSKTIRLPMNDDIDRKIHEAYGVPVHQNGDITTYARTDRQGRYHLARLTPED